MNQDLFSLTRLDWTIYLTWIGVAVILCTPRAQANVIRWTALVTALLGLGVALVGVFTYELRDVTADADPLRASFAQFEVLRPWIPALGISWHLGADGISLPILALNGVVAVTGVLFSWNVATRAKEFFAFFLTLISGVYGVFLALDLFLLFAFYELAIIPKYFVIAIWGSTRKEYAAMKLVLYSFIGSALVFVGILAVFVAAGAQSFDLFALRAASFSTEFQFWCFPLLFIGFAILAGMWPFHTWAPTGHAAAPTAASMLLAGVVMKLGAYGCLRVAMFLLPEGLTAYGGFWQWVIGILAVIGIIYGATVALVQQDFKFVIGYSSVSHMGFVLLGLVTLDAIGLDGAVLQMFSHGIVASLLFAVAGRMVYERTHTRDLGQLSTMRLSRRMPFVTITFVIGGLASMGLPGFSGFVAELQVLIGAWRSMPWLAIASGAGILLTIWYTFRAVHLVFFVDAPPSPAESSAPDAHDMGPITIQEKVASIILISILVIVGLYPAVLLDMIHYSVQLMMPTLGMRAP
jgi:NADH-quinone oxidoreductase subunit M